MRAVTGFFTALQFLTVAPPLIRRQLAAEDLAASRAFFPLVGLLIGLLLAGIDAGLRLVLPLLAVDAILVVSLLVVTGALHMDGLMDACDGVFASGGPERRLAIMRDPHAGSFAVAGALSVLLLKLAALHGLPEGSRLAGLAVMPALSRWAMVIGIALFPYARHEGKGAPFQHRAPLLHLLLATIITAAIAGGFLGWRGLIVMAIVGGIAWLMGRYFLGRLGGLTGDTYGAINEATEVVAMLGVVAFVG
ncbi:MAG: adenosylcobinamide-GDP ribazoletransferase [Chloroflexi bacterium]|nr:adenosylcobinamide-GDP ribazoletransferase [Chloroflexota bacterium]